MNPVSLILIPVLAGALVNTVIGFKLPRRAVELVACGSAGASAYFAYRAFDIMRGPASVRLFDWISFGGFSAPVELYLDAVSATMALMVTGVSLLIHIYSVGYMAGERGYARFFALMNLFVFSMLVLVLAGNLPLMYLGWEGVGFCSYALIGFWYEDTKNADAGRKAFVVTRVGDVAFGVALIWLYWSSGTAYIPAINSQAGALAPTAATAIGLLLLFGAAGKSAQLPLTTWLPDAMAGPTPVSALIHAATMVTAGVYLLVRMHPVIAISQTASAAITLVGAVTAFYAATAALCQHDIKRVLAYSTISQIGYMFMGVGAGALTGSLFHLFSHAFFKALLFMGAGCIIVALRHEQDMRRMGGLMYRMPAVFWSFLAGGLALCAAPGTSGFFSKDEILASVFSHGGAFYLSLWLLGELTALVTTLYIFRAVYLVFFGEAKTEPGPLKPTMLYTLVPLALLSIAGGFINAPESWRGSAALSALMVSHGVGGLHADAPWWLTAAAIAVPAAGFAVGYYLYVHRPALRLELAVRFAGLAGLLRSGWGLDALYQRLFVTPYAYAARFLWKRVDEAVVDASLDGLGVLTARIGTGMRASVTGRTSTYITAVVLGAAALLLYFTLML